MNGIEKIYVVQPKQFVKKMVDSEIRIGCFTRLAEINLFARIKRPLTQTDIMIFFSLTEKSTAKCIKETLNTKTKHTMAMLV